MVCLSGFQEGDTKHNTSALGNISYLLSNPDNTRNGSLSNTTWCADCHLNGSNIFNDQNLTNSTWCSACHYNDSTSNYKGNLIDPAPPEILNATGKVPSIASDGTSFYNHSEIQNYNDSHCKNCHGSLLTGYLETSLNFSHRVSEGGGSKDCISCHNKSATGSPLDMRVDGSAINQGIHMNLNSKAYNSSATDPINKACWACHTGGEEPGMHPPASIRARKCSSCHTYQEKPFYDAKYVGDEPHGFEKNCEYCHYWGSHNVVRFQVTPGIKEASLSPEKPGKGDKVILVASAHSGYRMSINKIDIDLCGFVVC